jgi:hypothetical protein
MACPNGHRCELPTGAVVITHTAMTVLGVSYECPICRSAVSLSLPAPTISMLIELGVELANGTLPADRELAACSGHRRQLSEQLLSPQPVSTKSAPGLRIL